VLLTVLSWIVVIGGAIFVHELGHFLVAKLMGVGVVRFSIGFGPPTPLRFRRGETEYVLSWFPLGGYVMMASEEEAEIDQESGAAVLEGGAAGRTFPPDQLFERKPLEARFAVMVAGVAMNAVFAWITYSAVAAAYGRVEDPTTTVAAVETAVLPAVATAWATVPLPATITRVNGRPITSWGELQEGILDPGVDALSFELAERADPVVVPLAGTTGEARTGLLRALVPHREPRVAEVTPGRPAARAGVLPGDLIVSANGDTVRHWHQLVRVIEGHPGDTVRLGVLRQHSRLALTVVPITEEVPGDGAGSRRVVGKIGVGVESPVRRIRFTAAGAVVEGVRRTVADASLVIVTLKGLILGDVSLRELGGPIFVGQVSAQVARLGLEPFLSFLALFSVNLAVLNLLPIPVLDGGRLVFLLWEGVVRRPLPRRLRLRLTQAGMAFLLALMLFVIANDIVRIVGR
jgi:regulator of sigma E protease